MEHAVDGEPDWELALDRGQSLPDAIAEKIRELIEVGTYRPNSRLPTEAELARKMKVARSSVRTALQRLETRRLVEVRRGLGWYVRRSAPAEPAAVPNMVGDRHYRLSDLFEVRMGLEALAVSLAAVRISDGEVADIAKLNRLHAEAEGQDELLRTDEQFHEAIVRASRNPLLIENYLSLVPELAQWRYQSFASPGVPIRCAREHSRIVRFLRSRDAAGARAAMNSHLQPLYDEIADIEAEPLDLMSASAEPEVDWLPRRESAEE
jgi:GntR family transcriptional repressor for pyruvate dehydrogenase complex